MRTGQRIEASPQSVASAEVEVHARVPARSRRPWSRWSRRHVSTEGEVLVTRRAGFWRRLRVRLGGVGRSARLALQAPRMVVDARHAAKSWIDGQRAGLALLAIGAALGVFFLAVLTTWAVAALDMAVGAPWGALIVAGFYAVAAAACLAVGLAQRKRGRLEAERRIERVKEEFRGIARPMREAWQQEPRAPRMR